MISSHLNLTNDCDSVDYDFFDSEDGRISSYGNRNSRVCTKVITQAVIETQPLTHEANINSNSLSLKANETYSNIDSSKLTDLTSSFLPSTEISMEENSKMEKSLANCLAYADERNLVASSGSFIFCDRDCSDNSLSDSTITSELTSVSPCSLLSDSSLAVDDSTDSSKSLNVNDAIEAKDVNKKMKSEECNSKSDPLKSEFRFECGVSLKNKSNTKNACYLETNCENEVLKHHEISLPLKKEHNNILVLEEEFRDISLFSQLSTSSLQKSAICRGQSKLKIRKKENTNITFNKEEVIKIERDNLILLKKIMSHSKPRSVSLHHPFTHKRTSAAINRAKQQKKIEQDNYILYSKISAVGRMKKVF